MKKITAPFAILFAGVTFLFLYHVSADIKAKPEGALPTPIINPSMYGIFTSRTAASGLLNTSTQMVLGPNICINEGDPFSPLNSPYAPGPYTYQYVIRIPTDYPYDFLRVELFDPDSINTDMNEVTISRSQAAINAGQSVTDSKTCGSDGGSSEQKNSCLLKTDELNLVTSPPHYDIDQVNPYWFVRIDENRGAGGAPGDGTCGEPGNYNAAYNTATLYQLYYFRQNTDGTIERIDLVSYTGQTGDGGRDNGEHRTDMRWVSPGASVPFSTVDDPGTAVPVDPGSSLSSFEINLYQDVPNIYTDPNTGERFLYLDITALSGASENGFEIWAGPHNYVDAVPSEVNARNLYLANNPGSHDAMGVEILALGSLPQNATTDEPAAQPLLYVGPEYAGESITISLFDFDDGGEPPMTFYFDTIADSDWSFAFGVVGQDDPDGVAEGVRCLPGNCPTQWVDPPYKIIIPGDLDNCDYQNPEQADCTPFYGGRLMVRRDAGINDNFVWQISLPSTKPLPNDATGACDAFPIAIGNNIRSVTEPGIGANPYPGSGEFEYPLSPPTYDSFLDHTPDIPLPYAEPGNIYRLANGLETHNFSWLVWNEGITNTSGTLASSLTWPGNSRDYTVHGDDGVILPGFTHVVRGYVEPGDPSDRALHVEDWLAAFTGSANVTAVRTPLELHVDTERALRLPIWENNDGERYQVAGFAVFRLVGYSLTDNWLLLEFLNWDMSCGQFGSNYLPLIIK